MVKECQNILVGLKLFELDGVNPSVSILWENVFIADLDLHWLS